MSKYICDRRESNSLMNCICLLVVASLVTKSINCFVLDQQNTEWSTVAVATEETDIQPNRHETSNNVTNNTSMTGDNILTDFLAKFIDNDNDDDNAHDGDDDEYSMDDIETGKY